MVKLFKPKPGEIIGYDTECTGLNPWGDYKRWGFYPARPYAFSFYDLNDNHLYIRWEVDPETREVIQVKSDINRMQDILENDRIGQIGHNLGYDIRMSRLTGIDVNGPIHDTLIQAHVVTGGDEMEYGLKSLAVKYLNISKDDERDLRLSAIKGRTRAKKKGWCIAEKGGIMGKDPIKADYWLGNKKLCKRYAIFDAKRTLMFHHLFQDDLKIKTNAEVYAREMKLLRVVMSMEDRGTRIFPEDIDRLRGFYGRYMMKHKFQANRHGGKGLNYNSPKQKCLVFFKERGYEPLDFGKTLKRKKNGKTGAYYPEKYPDKNPKCDGDFLKHIADTQGDKLAKAILEYKGGSHMLSAFLNPYDAFRTEEKPDVWVLHPNYRQCGPVTGRFSCSDPNLMQVASETTGRRRTDITLKPRECFGPRKGYVWYLPDYSQVEVWAFAFLSQEKAMMDALLTGRDFHGAVAEQVWGDEPGFHTDPEKKKYFRKRAKLLMFCKLYGGGTGKVAYLTDSTYEEAAAFVRDFDVKLPGVQRFMNHMIRKAEMDGKIVNPFGRTYYISSRWSYKAVNYMIQGTCADLLKEAMIRIYDMFKVRWTGSHLLLTLHDELGMEIPLHYHSRVLMREIIAAMQVDSVRLNIPVPLPVGMKIVTKRWNETQDIKFYRKDLKKWV